MPRIVLALAVTALAASFFGACQRKKKAPKDEPRKVVSLPPTNVPMLVLAEKLLEPGASPRKALRYKAVEGMTLGLQARAELTETIDGKPAPVMALPTVTTTFEVSWADGNPRVLRSVARAATIEPTQNSAAADAARGLISRYNTLLRDEPSDLPTTARGLLGHRPLPDPTAEGKQRGRAYIGALADLIVALPEAPIGVGARWRVVRAVPRAQTNVKQTIVYELTERDGDRLVIKLSGTMTGERQPIDAPSLPNDARAELLALRATVEGRLVIDLRRPAAVSGEMIRTDTVHTRATRRGQVISDYFSESTSTISVSSRDSIKR